MRPELLALAASLAAREARFAVVTVVRREPPSSARVGDAALVTESGDYHGWAGGGCTRETVVREAQAAIADGEARFISLSPAHSPGGDAARAGMVAQQMTCDSGGTVEIYVEPVLPAPRLFLFGASPAVRCLSRIAQAMGWRVDVVHPDAEAADFPGAQSVQKSFVPQALPEGAHVLVATMGDDDAEVLRAVLASRPAYVGVIASRKRFAQLGSHLGVPEAALAAVAAPAGLDIGARTPEEIALSVMAQIVEKRRKPSGEKQAPASVSQKAVDPICGMTVTVATARHTAEVRGVAYYFCCAGCRSKFLEKGVSA
jgi:xanthine dehydrogenase accessory factor